MCLGIWWLRCLLHLVDGHIITGLMIFCNISLQQGLTSFKHKFPCNKYSTQVRNLATPNLANLHTFMTESLPKTNILLGFSLRINVLPQPILKAVNIKKIPISPCYWSLFWAHQARLDKTAFVTTYFGFRLIILHNLWKTSQNTSTSYRMVNHCKMFPTY